MSIAKILNDFKKTFREFVIITASQTLVMLFFLIVAFLSSEFFGFDLAGLVTSNDITLVIVLLLSFACAGFVAVHVFHLNKNRDR